MSTKIYNGFQVATNSASELLVVVNGFRPWIAAQSQQMLEAFITGSELEPFAAWTLWQDVRQRTVEKGFRGPTVDTDFDLVFFPDGERFLGIMFTEHAEWKEEWLRQPGIREYAFWTSSEQPESLSDDEWALRHSSWERVLGWNAPSQVGFSVKVSDIQGPRPKFTERRDAFRDKQSISGVSRELGPVT